MNRNLINSKEGSLSFAGILLSMIFILYFFFSLLALSQDHYKLKKRVQLYLCFKYLHQRTLSYTQTINRQNIKILSTYTLTIIPWLSPYMKSLKTSIQYIQATTHLSYMKNLISNKWCSLNQGSFFIKNIPYKVSSAGQFLRGFFGTVLLGRKRWTNIIFHSQDSFIQIDYVLKSPYGAQLSSKTSEEVSMDTFFNPIRVERDP